MCCQLHSCILLMYSFTENRKYKNKVFFLCIELSVVCAKDCWHTNLEENPGQSYSPTHLKHPRRSPSLRYSRATKEVCIINSNVFKINEAAHHNGNTFVMRLEARCAFNKKRATGQYERRTYTELKKYKKSRMKEKRLVFPKMLQKIQIKLKKNWTQHSKALN